MKNKKPKKIIVLLLIVSLLASFSGCEKGVEFFVSVGETKYRAEHTIHLPMEKVRTLNPMISKDEDTYFLSKLLYDGLFELDGKLAPQKKLADSYAYSNDKLSLVIELKQGVKWHDGEEFTAEDVKFSIDTYCTLSYSNETIYTPYVANIRYVTYNRADPYKVTVVFRNADNVGAENLIFPILPAHQFRRVPIRRNTEAFIPIGTGPYKVSVYNNLSKLSLEANPGYFGGAVPKNTLEFTIFPKKKDALNLVDIENISLLINTGIDRDTLISNMNVKTVNFVSNKAEFIAFNMASEILENKKMRQAICYAVDSKDILESAYLKSGVISDTIYYPYYFGNQNEEEPYPFDLDKAAALIKESWLTENVSLGILVNSDDGARMAAAQIIKNALDKLPLDSYIIYCDREEYLARIAEGKYDIYLGGYTFNERYDLRGILHSKYSNKEGYFNQTLDGLLDEMQSGVTNERKAELFSEVNSILKDEIPYYCILYKTYGAIFTSSLVGEVEPLFNNYYRDCGEWARMYEIPAVVAE